MLLVLHFQNKSSSVTVIDANGFDLLGNLEKRKYCSDMKFENLWNVNILNMVKLCTDTDFLLTLVTGGHLSSSIL